MLFRRVHSPGERVRGSARGLRHRKFVGREDGGGQLVPAVAAGVVRDVHQPRGAVEQGLGHGGVGQGAESQDEVKEQGGE